MGSTRDKLKEKFYDTKLGEKIADKKEEREDNKEERLDNKVEALEAKKEKQAKQNKVKELEAQTKSSSLFSKFAGGKNANMKQAKKPEMTKTKEHEEEMEEVR